MVNMALLEGFVWKGRNSVISQVVAIKEHSIIAIFVMYGLCKDYCCTLAA